jgi:hypothetical protein
MSEEPNSWRRRVPKGYPKGATVRDTHDDVSHDQGKSAGTLMTAVRYTAMGREVINIMADQSIRPR